MEFLGEIISSCFSGPQKQRFNCSELVCLLSRSGACPWLLVPSNSPGGLLSTVKLVSQSNPFPFFFFSSNTFLTFCFLSDCLINQDFILIVFIFKWSLAAIFSICFDSLLQN